MLSIMQPHHSFFLAALASTCVEAFTVSLIADPSATPLNLGDPSKLSNYPLCAQICANQVVAAAPLFDYGCDLTEAACLCQAPFRAKASFCEEIACSVEDNLKVQALGQQLCGPFYEKNKTLESAVSSAIVSATSAAVAATKSKNPTNPAVYPPCVQACFDRYVPLTGCGNLANRTCVCNDAPLVASIVRCQYNETKCSSADLERFTGLADKLCFTDGSVPNLNTSGPLATGSRSNTSASRPSPSPFTGQAAAGMADGFALCITIAVGLLGVVVLGL